MSGSSTTCFVTSSSRTTRTYGFGRAFGPVVPAAVSAFADHMKPMRPRPTQPPVMRSSQRLSQLTPLGVCDRYGPVFQGETGMSCVPTAVEFSGQENRRIWLCEESLLAKYITLVAPCVQRGEPSVVVSK